MSSHAARLERYRERRASAMGDQGGAQGLDPQLQLLITSFTQALGQVVALQPAPQPTASARPTVPPKMHLPPTAIKLPTFHDTTSDPADPNRRIKCFPASVVSCLSRIDVFFESYAHSYSTDALNLNALIACFPLNSQAQFWHESDNGKTSFRTNDEFKKAFVTRFVPNASDEATCVTSRSCIFNRSVMKMSTDTTRGIFV
jgi:hypothetical protein